MTRVVIGVQLVMAGYQLPAKYPWHRWRDMALLLIPVMTIMWLCTTGCIKLMIPKLTTLTAMVSQTDLLMVQVTEVDMYLHSRLLVR
jgi:NhaP-type Na+/H+ or K+/H+ antiporter